MCGALEAKFSLLLTHSIYTELANLLTKLSMERERFLWLTVIYGDLVKSPCLDCSLVSR